MKDSPQLASSSEGGTCQCLADHTYNYQVDGCESNERIRERKSNMRMLIILFVIAGSMFGFALTFNFGMLGGGQRAQAQAILMKRLAEEKERQQRQQQQQGSVKSTEEAATAPPYDQTLSDKPVDLEANKTADKKLIAL